MIIKAKGSLALCTWIVDLCRVFEFCLTGFDWAFVKPNEIHLSRFSRIIKESEHMQPNLLDCWYKIPAMDQAEQ